MEVKFENVSFSYNPNTSIEKEVLKNINMTIEEGKITSIIGKSGSGKTTIAELIDFLIIPTEGKITIGENEITPKKSTLSKTKKIRKDVGLVFQFPEEQFFNMTVEDEISFSLKYYKYKTVELKKRVLDSLIMVGLDESYLKRNPFTLSNGEKRKVAIASTLALNPKVIIFDEPTIGMDSKSKKNFISLLRKLKTRYQKTIVLISHDIDFVHILSDYIYVLDNKSIYMEGKKYDVFKKQSQLENIEIKVPKIIEFSNLVKDTKGIKIGYRDNINDLIKDIYRYVK